MPANAGRFYPGCNIHGVLYFRKVMGVFVFISKPAFRAQGGFAVMDAERVVSFNASHYIRRFRVGSPKVERFPGVIHPLEGHRFINPASQSQSTVRYFVDLVPTEYRVGPSLGAQEALDDSSVEMHSLAADARHRGHRNTASPSAENALTNRGGLAAFASKYFGAGGNKKKASHKKHHVAYEYAVREHHHNVDMMMGMMGFGEPPSVAFTYSFASTQLTRVFERPPLSTFVVRACSVMGGVFVLISLCERGIEALARAIVDTTGASPSSSAASAASPLSAAASISPATGGVVGGSARFGQMTSPLVAVSVVANYVAVSFPELRERVRKWLAVE
jgi:hypothetical protein